LGRGAKLTRRRNGASGQFRNRRTKFYSWRSHSTRGDSHTTNRDSNTANNPNYPWIYVSKRNSKHYDTWVDLARNSSTRQHDATFHYPEQFEQFRNFNQRFAV